MANLLKISGPASALLLLAALLAAGVRADYVSGCVTTEECKARGITGRLRQYPVDSDATVLDISECSLTDIHDNMLAGLPNLKKIFLYRNNIQYIDPSVLHAVPTLKTLTLWGNKFRELPVFDEHACPILTGLYLFKNQLTEINNGSLSACKRLEDLDLGYNQIEFIHTSVFTTFYNLKSLNLQYNKIRYIPDQMFVSNGKLEELYLDGNRIAHLPPDFTSKLNLHVFYFDKNPWHCGCLIELLADVRRADVRYYRYVKKGAYDGSAPVCVYTGAAPCSAAHQSGCCAPRGGGGGR